MPAMLIPSQDASADIAAQVRNAYDQGTPLQIQGGGSKAFYGHSATGTPLSVKLHSGVVNYDPRELVITLRAGSALQDAQALLTQQGQMLPFEPPHFGTGATLGGTIAGNFSGPRRPYTGAARDFVLGARIVNGRGETLQVGGQVIKNVAGYDVARLMAGALGTLGVLLEVTLKVLPRPDMELTVARRVSALQAIADMNGWAARPLPLSATSYDGDTLRVRLSGTPGGVHSALKKIGGSVDEQGEQHWQDLREQRLYFFSADTPLWRIAVTPATPPLDLPGTQLIEWGGALRWYTGEADAAAVRRVAEKAGGHAILFRRGTGDDPVFHPLPAPLLALHRRIKAAFDPKAILNPGRLYPDL
jgi:glycolate oxidase FAD binding subunit